MKLKISAALPSFTASLLQLAVAPFPASALGLRLNTPPPSTSFRAEKTGGCSSHHIIITAGYNWKQGSFLLGCMVTQVSVCSDISRASNSPSHLPSTERRQKSLTARWTSKAQCSHAPLRCKLCRVHRHVCNTAPHFQTFKLGHLFYW